ncbi:MAG: hypothetical protein UY72_C0035G0018 [Candidatus Uhrbacteria bacterium GW2011_GWD2_52_7]|uniref:Uncharacterized protein n=1 Tax=Candidatus Uhrbacteria bacterium GW2011_GWD2_52_7 TaxID=1618989 RepID=A0A0G1XEN6_9BACT|nr:MAG: hypothetical protein UY72_C0035G0018 [Candidatus Uhrbacteria bacterium GW2011_GWD2_52_7]
MKQTLVITASIDVALVLAAYAACFHYTPVGQVGIMRNVVNGKVMLDHSGMNFSPPWVFVAKLPTTPVRVCLSSASRAYNCKLAQFEPSAHQELVATEGFRYYWWDNRLSFNWGYDVEYRGADDLIRGYAFSVKQYAFVHVLNDYLPE